MLVVCHSGLSFRSDTVITDSTISGNTARRSTAALSASSQTLIVSTISNSTIAFNHADVNSPYAAVYFRGQSASSSLTLQSTIIANNTAGASNVEADLFLAPGYGVLSSAGADNLIMSANVPFPPPGVITVTSDPKLGPLQFNGGTTRTHALLPGSPAIGFGNHDAMPQGSTNDQRGAGYPRTTGTGANETTDIGAFEFDTIFAASFDF